jgi:hypothetical protein
MGDDQERLNELRRLQKSLDKAEREKRESAAKSLWDEA